MKTTLLLWASKDAAATRALAEQALRGGLEVFVVGADAPDVPGAKVVREPRRAVALKIALQLTDGEVMVLQEATDEARSAPLGPNGAAEPRGGWSLGSVPALTGPIERDEADVVLGCRAHPPPRHAALDRLARLSLDAGVRDVATGQKAVRTAALRELTLKSDGLGFDAELLVKLAAHLYRFSSVEVPGPVEARPWPALLALGRTFVRYTTVADDADNEHEGYSTLAHLEAGAPNYNAWLAERFRQHAGARVLEIGAGIGTITAGLAPGRELVVALEVDPFYVRRLGNRFRGQANVEPYQSDVALADRAALAARRFDTIVLSNVLEHIADDADAVRTFGQILAPGGRVLILVPALPFLFGSIDEAVGHHRRYTPAALRQVLEGNGFEVERLDWMNLLGIPGWLLNGRVLRRRVLPPLQLRLYDQVAPLLARAEANVRLPVGMSLFCVARRT